MIKKTKKVWFFSHASAHARTAVQLKSAKSAKWFVINNT